MPRDKGLVLCHLEDVSWLVLKDYPEVVRQMIRGEAGVYALYRRGNLYYVGLASNLMRRLKSHLKDRHKGSWDRFSVYLTIHHEHMKELESLILRIADPKGNKTKGRFASSTNLRLTLHRLMAERDADRRARLMGGHVARRRRRVKTRRTKGTRCLEGVVDRSIRLRARHRGREYKARLLTTGEIGYRRMRFDSPTAAARAVAPKTRNGWIFWQYRNDRGEWVALREIRR